LNAKSAGYYGGNSYRYQRVIYTDKAAVHYAPAWKNDKAGNLYLDIMGMRNIYGSPAEHSNRIKRKIIDQIYIKPTTAVAANKLVPKVATRAIRPAG
jgi:hypothetical protein